MDADRDLARYAMQKTDMMISKFAVFPTLLPTVTAGGKHRSTPLRATVEKRGIVTTLPGQRRLKRLLPHVATGESMQGGR